MKHRLIQLSTLIALTLTAFSARAIIILQDNFNYPDGALNDVAGGVWGPEMGSSTNARTVQVVSGQAFISTNNPGEFTMSCFTNGDGFFNLNFTTNGQTFFTNNPVGYLSTNSPNVAVYYSFTINLALPRAGNSYFATLADTNFHFRCRTAIISNTPTTYRIGINNSANASSTNILQQNLSYATPYVVVARHVISSGASTVWVAADPTTLSETNTIFGVSTNASDGQASSDPIGRRGIFTISGSTSNQSTCAFALRNGNSACTNVYLTNLLIGTTFADVVPGSLNPPSILIQPADAGTLIVSNSVSFTNLSVGDPTLVYQWYKNTNTPVPVPSATTRILTLTNLALSDSGVYSCVVTNPSGVNTTRFASLSVILQPVRVTITNQPQSQTVNVGDSATLSVVAGGVPAPTYQWKFIRGGVTNILTNATSSSISFDSLTTNQSGDYFVAITNTFPSGTNSALATLTVNPPQLLPIATLRMYLETNNWSVTNQTTIYVAQGIVTTWTNYTTSTTSTEFFIQDSTGGIAVFWSGADPSTNLPPAGALVKVTAPLAQFNGLLELEPFFTNTLHSVIIISTNNALPAPQPLPFDPNVVADEPTMQKLEGTYFVASNVFLDASSPTYPSGSTFVFSNIVYHVLTAPMFALTFTNNANDTFQGFIGATTDIAGRPRPSGPVTMLGVLGKFSPSLPYSGGYQFTPTRLADIIQYVIWTNYLHNVSRLGDSLTNNFTENVLRPGEGLTMDVALSDPAGAGGVTLAPSTAGLPATAYWTNVSNGLTARATLVFNPAPADAGSNYLIGLGWTTASGTASNFWNVYVPTTTEQRVYLTEAFAVPTTDPTSRAYNPLGRSVLTNTAINDQYVEILNLSDTDIDLTSWSVGDATKVSHTFGSGTLSSSNVVIVYGGPKNNDPGPPTLSAPHFPANPGPLGLSSGGGVLSLHNQDGHLIDRISYRSSSPAGSLSRFPKLSDTMVPQQYISTNWVTPGLQYDGSPWTAPTKVPAPVTNVVISATNLLTTVTNVSGNTTNIVIVTTRIVKISFTADTTLASTFWRAGDVSETPGNFAVFFGEQYTNNPAIFMTTNPPIARQFYFISTQ
jgi:hypothetical protein